MRMLDLAVVTPADTLPITIEEFIDHARLNALTVDRQPGLIDGQLAAATERAEQYCRRALLTQTLRALFVPDGASCRCSQWLRLPRPPIQEVESVTVEGSLLDPASYTLNGWGVLVLGAALAMPATVVYKAGYGADGESVPAMIRNGILEYATVLYENRSGERDQRWAATANRTLPAGVIDLWRPFQVELSG